MSPIEHVHEHGGEHVALDSLCEQAPSALSELVRVAGEDEPHRIRLARLAAGLAGARARAAGLLGASARRDISCWTRSVSVRSLPATVSLRPVAGAVGDSRASSGVSSWSPACAAATSGASAWLFAFRVVTRISRITRPPLTMTSAICRTGGELRLRRPRRRSTSTATLTACHQPGEVLRLEVRRRRRRLVRVAATRDASFSLGILLLLFASMRAEGRLLEARRTVERTPAVPRRGGR